MSEPTFDRTTGWWSIRYYAGKGRPRVKVSLLRHPGWKAGMRPPRRVPPEVEAIARKYQDLEVKAKHGVDVTPARPADLADYLARYLSEVRATRSPSSIEAIARTLAKFAEFCRGRRVTTLQAVTVALCRDFQLARLAVPSKLSTVVTERRILSPAFRRAAAEGLIPKNPWAEARIEGKARQEEAEPIYWTEDELSRLIAACKGWSRDAAIVAANAGLRITSLLNLEWRDVDFGRGLISVRADVKGNKAKRRYDAPMLDAAREVLERRRFTEKGSDYVFPSKRTGKPHGYKLTYETFRRAVVRSGIPDKGHYNHILRHTFITLALMRGVPLPVVSRWAGHTNIAMTMRYFHACKDESAQYTTGLSFGTTRPPGGDDGRNPSPSATGPSPGDDR